MVSRPKTDKTTNITFDRPYVHGMAANVKSLASKGSDEETGKRTDRKRVRDGKVCALCGRRQETRI